MNVKKLPILAGLALIIGATGVSADTVSVLQMKACKNALLDESKFEGLPMAAFSVYPGKKKNRAHFSVRWDGLRAEGHCVVSRDGDVEKVKIAKFHDGRTGNSDGGDSGEYDGFYYDRHVGKWRDPDGRVCHTCTPENGFPANGGHDW